MSIECHLSHFSRSCRNFKPMVLANSSTSPRHIVKVQPGSISARFTTQGFSGSKMELSKTSKRARQTPKAPAQPRWSARCR